MSEQDEQANHVAPSGPPLVDFWTSGFQQAAEHAQRSLGIAGGGGVDPRLWRRQWLDTLAHAADAYLRSPMFLLMLRTHVDSLVQAKLASDSERSDPPSSSRQMADDIQAMRSRLDQLQQQLDLVDETLRGTSDPEIEARPENEAEPSAGQERVASKPPSPAARERGTGATPYDVVYQEGLLKLLRYRGDSVRFAEPILVCFALVNRPYILDLKTDRSVVRRLLDRGFDVYLIDWGIPDEASSQLRLDDYVCKFLDNVVSFVCDSVGTPQLNLLGYCMGGTMSTMFTALQPDRVRNLILMATPIDFAGDEGLLNLWAREEYFDVDKLIDAFGNCPGEFLKFVFQLMKPVQNFAEKQLTLSENLSDATFVDNFVAVERWAADSIPVVGETFRQYVKSLYQQNQLVKGQLRLAGKPVRLEAIDCPLLLLVAEKDHLVTPESTLALKQHVRSKESQSISIDAGHVGLAVSSRAHRRLWPEAANWIANHSTEL